MTSLVPASLWQYTPPPIRAIRRLYCFAVTSAYCSSIPTLIQPQDASCFVTIHRFVEGNVTITTKHSHTHTGPLTCGANGLLYRVLMSTRASPGMPTVTPLQCQYYSYIVLVHHGRTALGSVITAQWHYWHNSPLFLAWHTLITTRKRDDSKTHLSRHNMCPPLYRA